jgi:hypothetical protein
VKLAALLLLIALFSPRVARAEEAETSSATVERAEVEVEPEDGERTLLVPVEPNPLSIGPASTATLAEVMVHERREAPFDPDSELRLTGRQLRELGIMDLAEALDVLPGVVVRGGGRGGLQADIRGAKKGSVMVLVDGVPIQDPYFGNFDVSTIPTTDIAEIRISQAPASPLDGPGGPGGVVEVITRSAVGPTEAILRAETGDSPGGRGSGTVRTEALPSVNVRISGGGTVDNRVYDLPGTGPLGISTDTRTGQGALLIEHSGTGGRIGADLWASRAHYFVPQTPDSAMMFNYLFVDHEDSFRGALTGLTKSGELELSGRVFGQILDRDSIGYRTTLAGPPTDDDVLAHRYGGIARASYALLPELELQAAAYLVIEEATETEVGFPTVSNSSRLGETALGARYRIGALLFEGAGGIAVPISVGGLSNAWPEGRISGTYGSDLAQLRLTGARKGRVPTLRELYQVSAGAANVGPEMSSYGEAQLVLRPSPVGALTLGAYEKTIDGLIRVDPRTRKFGNVGDVVIQGLDTRIDLWSTGPLSAGIAYSFAHPTSATLGPNPLDFFPQHRIDAWAAARHRDLFGGWARIRWESTRTDNQGSTFLAPYATVDATLWVHYERTRILLRAENLLDRAYLARAGVVGLGRTIFLGLEAVLN